MTHKGTKSNKKKKGKLGSIIFSIFIVLIVLVSAGLFAINGIIYSRFVISGDSMYPNLKNNQIAYMNVRNKDIKRFDIVVVKYSFENSYEYWIKRIIGLPNETINYEDGKLYVNNVNVSEPFIDSSAKEITDNFEYRTVANEYFVMGDNREVSYDSRIVGGFKKSNIVGHGGYVIGSCSSVTYNNRCKGFKFTGLNKI